MVASLYRRQPGSRGEAAQGRLNQDIESSVGHTVAVAIQATAQYTYQSGSRLPGDGPEPCLLWVGRHRAFQPTAKAR